MAAVISQTRNISVGTVWHSLLLLGHWMARPRNADDPMSPLNGAPFLETLQAVPRLPNYADAESLASFENELTELALQYNSIVASAVH